MIFSSPMMVLRPVRWHWKEASYCLFSSWCRQQCCPMIQERSLLYLGCPSTRSNSIILSGSSSSFLRNASFIKQSSGKEFFSSHSDGKPTHNKGGNKIKLLVIAFGAGAAIGLVYYYRKTNEKTLLIGNVDSGNDLLFSEAPPIDRISKKIVNENDTSNLKLTLYQYEPCPFCKKVRAYLDYAGLSYDVVEVNSVTKKQLSWSPYKKVPIMVVKSKLGYQQLNDSSMIISSLTSLLLDTEQDIANIVRYYPRMDSVDEDGKKKSEIMNRYFLMFGDKEPARTKESITEERNWRKWSDDTLMHTLSPNLYRTWEESLEAFNMFSKNGDWERIFPSWERQMVIYVGAAVMYVIGKRLKKRHNLLDDARQSLYQETNHFLKAVEAKGTLFMGGEEPNLADLAVYGCISSIQGTRSFDDLMSNTSLASWYEPMRTAIENRRGKVIAC